MALTPRKFSADAVAASLALADHLTGIKGGSNVRFTGQQIADMLGIVQGTFNPAITFVTPGDLSVTYAEQAGGYSKLGGMLMYSGRCNFTPTFTTASGQLRFTGFPLGFSASGVGSLAFGASASSPAWPVGASYLVIQPLAGTSQANINSLGNGFGQVLTAAEFTSGNTYIASFSGVVRV